MALGKVTLKSHRRKEVCWYDWRRVAPRTTLLRDYTMRRSTRLTAAAVALLLNLLFCFEADACHRCRRHRSCHPCCEPSRVVCYTVSTTPECPPGYNCWCCDDMGRWKICDTTCQTNSAICLKSNKNPTEHDLRCGLGGTRFLTMYINARNRLAEWDPSIPADKIFGMLPSNYLGQTVIP